MRRDFDYVTMCDYMADMREMSSLSFNIIVELRKRAEKAERLMAEVVIAAGGRVEIDGVSPIHPNVPKVTISRDEYRDLFIVEAVRS